jgi:methionine aminopeptidase
VLRRSNLLWAWKWLASISHHPNIPHYANENKAKGTMKAGRVFTIEPMIHLGVCSDKTWEE